MIDAIVKLSVVVEFILSVNFAAFFGETQNLLLDLHQFHHRVSSLCNLSLTLFAHGRVEWCQDNRLAVLIFERAILRLQVVQSETINGLFILITIVSATIVISVLLLNHFALFIIKQLHCRVHTSKPRVAVNFSHRQTFLWVNFKQATK